MVLLLLQCITHLYSQNGQKGQDSASKVVDSLLWERLRDSVEKAGLEVQLKALEANETRARQDLEKQLKALHERDSLNKARQTTEIAQLRGVSNGYPVTGPFGDTLFLVYQQRAGFTPAERAQAISERIYILANRPFFSRDSLQVVEDEGRMELLYGDYLITTVSPTDALWYNSSKEELAEWYRVKISDAVLNYKRETGIPMLAKKFGLVLGIILVTGMIIYLISKLFLWFRRKIELQEGKIIKGIRLKNYTLFNSGLLVKAIHQLAGVIKWIIILLLIYFTLPLLFSIFPRTKNIAGVLTGYIMSPLQKIGTAIGHYLPNLFTIIILWGIFHYILKFFRFLKTEIAEEKLKIQGFHADWANPTFQIIRVLLYAFLFVLIFPYLPGSHSPIFKGVSVFLGFIFTFGSAGSLSNIVAGIILTYMRQFTLGDRVKIGDITGDVVEKTALVTRLKTTKNEIISIPNSTVMQSHTTNYSEEARREGLILNTTVTIGYDVPWRNMHAALLMAADRTPGILKTPAPFVLQTGLNDFYVSYQINAFTHEANSQAALYSLLHQNIQDCCFEAGIEILSPHFVAARDGNSSSIPRQYLPHDYKAPGFKFSSDQQAGGSPTQ